MDSTEDFAEPQIKGLGVLEIAHGTGIPIALGKRVAMRES